MTKKRLVDFTSGTGQVTYEYNLAASHPYIKEKLIFYLRKIPIFKLTSDF